MSEEYVSPPTSPDAWAKVVERLGLPAFLLTAVLWAVYTGLITPIAARYVSMVDEVRETNVKLNESVVDLRDGLRGVAAENQGIMRSLEAKVDRMQDLLEDLERALDPRGRRDGKD